MNPKLNLTFQQFEQRKIHLFQELDQLGEEQLHYQPATGQWSIVQVLDHLLTSEHGSLLYCMKKIKAGDDLPDSGILEPLKMWAYLQFLFSPIKFKAPKMVSNPSNEDDYQTIKKKHLSVNQKLEDFLVNYPDQYLKKAIYKHPIAGRITMLQMVKFFDAHLSHHLFQINRLIKQSKKL